MFSSVANSDGRYVEAPEEDLGHAALLLAAGPPARQRSRVADLLPDHIVIVSFHNCIFQVVFLDNVWNTKVHIVENDATKRCTLVIYGETDVVMCTLRMHELFPWLDHRQN